MLQEDKKMLWVRVPFGFGCCSCWTKMVECETFLESVRTLTTISFYYRRFRCRFNSVELSRTQLFASVQSWHWRKMMAINAQMSFNCIVCNIQYVISLVSIYDYTRLWKMNIFMNLNRLEKRRRIIKVYSDASNFQLTGATVI